MNGLELFLLMQADEKQIFGDKAALEILELLKDTDIETLIISILNESENSTYIPQNLGQKILISAALMDAVNNHTSYDLLDQWIIGHNDIRLKISRYRMINSVQKVLSKYSELPQIWAGQGGYSQWRDSVLKLIDRLSGNHTTPKHVK